MHLQSTYFPMTTNPVQARLNSLVEGGECFINWAISVLVWEELECTKGDFRYVGNVLAIHSLRAIETWAHAEILLPLRSFYATFKIMRFWRNEQTYEMIPSAPWPWRLAQVGLFVSAPLSFSSRSPLVRSGAWLWLTVLYFVVVVPAQETLGEVAWRPWGKVLGSQRRKILGDWRWLQVSGQVSTRGYHTHPDETRWLGSTLLTCWAMVECHFVTVVVLQSGADVSEDVHLCIWSYGVRTEQWTQMQLHTLDHLLFPWYITWLRRGRYRGDTCIPCKYRRAVYITRYDLRSIILEGIDNRVIDVELIVLMCGP